MKIAGEKTLPSSISVNCFKQIVHQSHSNVLVNTLPRQAPAALLPNDEKIGVVLHTIVRVLICCRVKADLMSKSGVYIDSSE